MRESCPKTDRGKHNVTMRGLTPNIWMEMAKSQEAIKAVAFARFGASSAAAETT